MKKLVCVLCCLLALCATSAFADGEKPIDVTQLPDAARQLISRYFPSAKVLLATVETEVLSKQYEVAFEDGTRLEFDSKGRWTDIHCPHASVPADLVPQAIQEFVKARYPDALIRQLEKDDKEYEVKLSNRIELTFNKKFQLVDVDM